MNKNFVVITTIKSPNKVIEAWSKVPHVDLIVIGDRKTPSNWSFGGVQYFDVLAQEKLHFTLLENLPFNHYCRKMVGYLIAINNGADSIVDTDDDNYPHSNWRLMPFDGLFDAIKGGKGFVNIFKYFTKNNIWPRGFPLDLVAESFNNKLYAGELVKETAKVGVWQGLADDDSDVDAIYRMLFGVEVKFDKRPPLVLDAFTVTPFNSQNTIFRKELFKLMYLPTFVTFRFTDILRGLIAQPILWAMGFKLGFTEATVFQERNEHDLMVDFDSEVPMYLNVKRIYFEIIKIVKPECTIDDNLICVYEKLIDLNITDRKELVVLKCWLHDINKISNFKI